LDVRIQMVEVLKTFAIQCCLALLVSAPAFADMQLVMVEEQGCGWCDLWDEEISEIYPKTSEGKQAPLRRVDIHERLPEDLSFSKGLNFTPTFVLFVHGVEHGRIEGYPGEDFFWGLLAVLINEADEIDATEG